MKIFDLKEFKVEITPQALLISPFSEIWKKDKSKDKESAYWDICYIWYFVDYDSPYFSYPDKEKDERIKNDVLLNDKYKPSDLVKKGIDEYRRLVTTPSIEMLKSAEKVIYKMKDYFSLVDFNETYVTKTGIEMPKFEIDSITNAILKMPKLMESINQAKEICKREQSTTDRVRGDKDVGDFEE